MGSPLYRHQEGQHPDESLLTQFGEYIEFAGDFWAKDAFSNVSNVEMVLTAVERMAKGIGQAIKMNGMKLVSEEEKDLNFKVLLRGPVFVSQLLQSIEAKSPAGTLKGKGQPKAPDIADPLCQSALNCRSTVAAKCFGEPTGALDEYIAYITSAFATLVESYNEVKRDNQVMRERLDRMEEESQDWKEDDDFTD